MGPQRITSRYFGQRLAVALESRGRQQKWLARELKVEQTTVSRWVTGKVLAPPGRRRNIEELLDLPDNWLDLPEAAPEGLAPPPHSFAVRELSPHYRPQTRDRSERPAGLSPGKTEEALAMLEASVRRIVHELIVQNELDRDPDRKRKAIRALKDLAQKLGKLEANVSDLWAAIDEVERTWPDISDTRPRP